LGYLEPGKFENMSESQRNTMLDACFSYNDELRKNGHLVAEEPLQPANTAVTVCLKNGKVAVTNGPYAEPKNRVAVRIWTWALPNTTIPYDAALGK
jgi:hypothetical protein